MCLVVCTETGEGILGFGGHVGQYATILRKEFLQNQVDLGGFTVSLFKNGKKYPQIVHVRNT